MNKITYPLKMRMRGQKVANLHAALQLLLDQSLLLADDEKERQKFMDLLRREPGKSAYSATTSKLVERFQREHKLQANGEVDKTTASTLNAMLEELGVPNPAAAYQITGRIISRISASVGGLRVIVVDKSIGADVTLGKTTTDSSGYYKVSFSNADLKRRNKDKPDLQARVFSGKQLLAASEVHYDASTRETLNVLLDEKASNDLPSEYETLTAAIAVHYRDNLGKLQETDDRQDITYLANKTGWDARAVALMALAEQFSTRSAKPRGGNRLDPALFYALFRSGLPANETAVYRTDLKIVENIWEQALKQGVIPSKLRNKLPAAIRQFQQLAARQLMEDVPLVGISSFKDILGLSIKDNNQQESIADLYVRYGNDPETFWSQTEKVLGKTVANRLKLDGQLAYLTLNNAPLISKLHSAAGQNGLGNLSQLVASGFYRATQWRQIISNDPIPSEIPGKDTNEKRERYAEFLAAKVRLSFPTTVVAQMVKNKETPIDSAQDRSRIHAFLTQHEDEFEIGMQPIAQYIVRNNLKVAPEVTREIARIQRVRQITPNDESMNKLLKSGIDSAHGVMRYERDEFIRAFKDTVGGEENARLIHAKSQQVHLAVLNIALTFLTARSGPGIGVHSPASIVDPTPSPPANASDVLAYSTLESLFGEMDYCTCEHCRSILSPAAYLVDLLNFIDRPASEVPAGFTNPQTVLLDRRPDIQHLPLTCENTNTPLPYIDLVNETLEYFITNGLSLSDTDPDPNVNSEYTGHNTESSAKSDELLASPQFVSEAAYTALVGENFPPPLPFHQPLENLRRFYRRFEAHLQEVMEELRKDDNLERASAAEFGWRDIWMETLKLSRAEYRLLTERWLIGGATDIILTVKQLFGFDPAVSDADVRAVLDNAKSFSRRVEISYEELVEILKTRFVNPNSDLIPQLERLGIPFATLKAFKDGTISDDDFDAMLPPGLNPEPYGGDVKIWVKDNNNYGRIMSLLTLTNPSDPEDVCSFDDVELRYSNPDMGANQLRPFEYIRLCRFIRLWKKLNWSIEQTDKTITALYPPAQTPDDNNDSVNLERLDSGFLELLPRLGIVWRVLGLLKLKLPRDLLPLLACFAPIDAHGESSLYQQMFLSPSRLDHAFAGDGYGNYLIDATKKLFDHTETLRAAFSLTAGEFHEISNSLGYDVNTPLSLVNISAIFRRGWLARKLKMSVWEFLLLTKFTGYDPFEVPDPVKPAFVHLIDLVDRLRVLGVKPVQVLYLIWNEDLSGKSVPAETQITAFARTLRSALAAIETEFAIVDDPDGSIARARMTLVYGNEAADLFFGLLENTYVTAVEYDHGQTTLEQPILDAAPGRITYDDFRKRLSFAGVLTPGVANGLKAVAGVTQEFKDAVDELFIESHKVIDPFFERYPELLPLHDAYLASAEPVKVKRNTLLEAILPELIRRRKRQQTLHSVSAIAEAEIGPASTLLENAAVLHATRDPNRPALDDLTAIETPGLSTQYFFASTTGPNPDLSRDAEANLEYTGTGTNQLPPNATTPGAAISGIWNGYLEAPENGFYNIRIDTDAPATVSLKLNGVAITLSQNGGAWSNATAIELLAGIPYAISITVENVKNNLAVHWQTAGRGWEVIPASHLYPTTLVKDLLYTYIRFLKAATLAATLHLTAAEIAHLAADANYQVGGEGWLNHLPVEGSPDTATAVAFLTALYALLDFSQIKADVSSGDERLLEVLRDPVSATTDPESLFFVLTRREKTSLDDFLTHFGKTAADLAVVETLRRVYDACGWAGKLGVPAAVLIEATTNEPNADMVRILQSALRARYDEGSWLEVLRPINDEMRSMQRDALVAYILHRLRSDPASAHIDTPEKLFEYFLMDVQMDPCMLTSRIRHALSSVQLFIERCLMNLEPRVSPASIKVGQWAWMKRYRVWEANRKVFLWPENWLEPELRDDQSPFFKETMSELLQGDITEDRAAEALVGYLTKLEEVAKLEICGVHFEKNEEGTNDDIVHVIARTAGANRKYFYRRREYGYWMPWEKVNLDIEDNPVLPVIWKNRLFLFWLKLVQETEQEDPPAPTGTLAGVDAKTVFPNKKPKLGVKVILNWSEFLKGKWQPARTSDPAKPLLLETVNPGTVNDLRPDLRLAALFWPFGGVPDAALRIIVSYKGWRGSSFFLYNPFSTPELRTGKKEAHFSPRRSLDTNTEPLKITYAETDISHAVLSNSIPDNSIDPHHPISGNPWDPPFFYEDKRHIFYVTTEERLVSVPHWNDIGIIAVTPKPSFEIPALIPKPFKEIVELTVPHIRQPGFGVIDPPPIDYFVTEDAYIRTAIGSPGTVTYGDRDIGPTGSQFRVNITR